MKICIEQVPEGVSFSEYPPDTEFVFDEPARQRDPITHELLPRKKRPLIYPEDCK